MNSRSPNRQRPTSHRGAALWTAIVGALLCFFPASSAFAQFDAKAIMAGVYAQDTSHDASLRATLEVVDAVGHGVKKRFTLRRLGSFGNGKVFLRFSDPPELRGVSLLSIDQPGQPPQQWIYTPATERVRGVAPRERSER